MKRFLPLVAVLLVSACCKAPSEKSSNVVATLDGTPITNSDLREAAGSELIQAQIQLYEVQKGAVDAVIAKRLVEEAAKKKGVTPEQLVQEEVQAKVSISDEELKAFYEQNKAQAGGKSFDEVKEMIRNYLTQQQSRNNYQAFLDQLKQGHKIVYDLSAPRMEIAVGDSPSQGPKDAKVVVIEFSDYQCPFCSRAHDTMKKLVATYGDKIRYVFKDFPLAFHQEAPKAHEAARCAGEQGKYWEMGDVLFANQQALGVDKLKEYAKQIGLDQKKFDECLDSGKMAAKVQADQQQGQSVGVSGTPAAFINGRPVTGARPYEDFSTVIDEELAK